MSIQYNNIKFYRKELGLTQEQIAEHIGVSRQTIAKWERGESFPDIENCIALADLFGISIDLLVRNINISGESKQKKHIFGYSKINEKGEIALSQKCLDMFNLKAGDAVLILGDEDKGIAIMKLGSISEDKG